MDSLHLSNITNLENNSVPTTLAVSTDVYQVINFENVNSTNRIFLKAVLSLQKNILFKYFLNSICLIQYAVKIQNTTNPKHHATT
jgi:hypothetical protein